MIIDHDPNDEDRRPIFAGPWCENCGDAFDGPERACPRPSPGRPLVDCGRGGHMFRKTVEPLMGKCSRCVKAQVDTNVANVCNECALDLEWLATWSAEG